MNIEFTANANDAMDLERKAYEHHGKYDFVKLIIVNIEVNPMNPEDITMTLGTKEDNE